MPFQSGPSGEGVDLSLSGALGFVCGEGMRLMTTQTSSL